MSSQDERTIRTMRYMAWSRAKGELASILETYWEDQDAYDQMRVKIKEFVEEVESLGLQE